MSIASDIRSGLRAAVRAGIDPRRGQPATAAQVAAALGYGSFSAGWLMQETSGNLAPAFGAPTLTATSLVYQNPGTSIGDYAVSFDAVTDNASGGDVFDVNATDDLVVAWVGKFSAVGADFALFTKRNAGAGWIIQARATGALRIETWDASIFPRADASGAYQAGEWHVGIAVIDRGAGRCRIGSRGLSSGATVVSTAVSLSTLGDMSNADSFIIGSATFGNAPTNFLLSALYIGTGSSVASGISTNLALALQNFASAVAP